MSILKRSVGFGGDNDPVDVCTVQYLLNCVPSANGGPAQELPVDGARHGGGFTRMVDAIRRFQARIFQGWSDGRVDPNGQTLMHLRRWNPADPSYASYVKQGGATPGIKGEDQALKTIKGEGSAAQKVAMAVAGAALKAAQGMVKQGPNYKESPYQKGAGGGQAKGMDFEGIKGAGYGGGYGGGQAKGAGYSSGQTKGAGYGGGSGGAGQAKGAGYGGGAGQAKGGGYGGGYGGGQAKGGDGGGIVKGSDGMKGGGSGFPGGPEKGGGSQGGFTDPFNMKGGGGGVNPSPFPGQGGQNIKGGPGLPNLN
jgi:hypothetical protein